VRSETLAEAMAGIQTCPRSHPVVLSISQPDHGSAVTLTGCSSPHPLRSSSPDSSESGATVVFVTIRTRQRSPVPTMA